MNRICYMCKKNLAYEPRQIGIRMYGIEHGFDQPICIDCQKLVKEYIIMVKDGVVI